MSVFYHDARYYNPLYKVKAYAGESAFVIDHLRKAGYAGFMTIDIA